MAARTGQKPAGATRRRRRGNPGPNHAETLSANLGAVSGRPRTVTIGKRVREALGAGYSPLMDGLAACCWFRYHRREAEPDSRAFKLYAGDRTVEVYVSPAGRSVRVWVDGQEVAR